MVLTFDCFTYALEGSLLIPFQGEEYGDPLKDHPDGCCHEQYKPKRFSEKLFQTVEK